MSGVNNTRYLAYREDNEFSVVCPVFKSEVKIVDCLTIEYHHMRGEPVPGRGGCHACMASSMCPIRHTLAEMGTRAEAYYSAEPKVGHFSAKVLERIDAVMIKDTAIARFEVVGPERAAIAAFENKEGRVAVTLAAAPAGKKTTRGAKIKKASTHEEILVEAAKGDMADAITAAVAAQPAAEAPVVKPAPTVTVQPPAVTAPSEPVKAVAAKPPKSPPAPKPVEIVANPVTTLPVAKKLSLLELARQMKSAGAHA